MDFDARDRLATAERRLAELESRTARIPIREASTISGDSETSVICGKAVGAVTGSDVTFEIDDISTLAGTDPRADTGDATETVTVQNHLAQSYNNDEVVQAEQWEPGGSWYPDKVGSGSGDLLTEFELTEDMTYADTAKLAKPLTAGRALDTAADAVYLLDLDGQHFGHAAYTSPAGAETGYRFWAKFATPDHAGGVPGWEIVAGDGPAPRLQVTVPAKIAPTDANLDLNQALSGGWAGYRLPKEESASFDLTISDPLGIGADHSDGGKFFVEWYRDAEEYRVVAKAENFLRIKGDTTSTVLRTDSTFAIDNVEALCGTSPVTLPTDTITVKNDPPIDIANGGTVYAVCDITAGSDKSDQWTTADAGNVLYHLRGFVDYDPTKQQVLDHDAVTGDPKWVDTGTCPAP